MKGYLLPLEDESPRLIDVDCEIHATKDTSRVLERPSQLEKVLGEGPIMGVSLAESGTRWDEKSVGPRINIVSRKTFGCQGSPMNTCIRSMTKGQSRTGVWTTPVLVLKQEQGVGSRYIDVDESVLGTVTAYLKGAGKTK